MITVEIRNFRAIRSALVEIDPMARLLAPHYGGKTTFCHAVAAAMCPEWASKLYGITAKEHRRQVNDRAEPDALAQIAVTGPDGGSMTLIYPGAKKVPGRTGSPPHADPVSLGLFEHQMLPFTKPAEWVAFLRELAGDPMPSAEETRAELLSVGVLEPEPTIKLLSGQPWDETCQGYAERARKLKGRWHLLTAQDWGSDKGATWLAEGVADEDLDRIDDLEFEVERLDRELQDAAGAVAVDAAERKRLSALAEKVGERSEGVARLEARLERLRPESEADARRLEEAGARRCPCCSAMLRVLPTGDLEEVEQPKGELSAVEMEERLESMREELVAAESAAAKLASSDPGPAEALERVRAQRDAARQRLIDVERSRHARAVHQEIMGLERLREVLGPGPKGLRARTLGKEIGRLNDLVVALSEELMGNDLTPDACRRVRIETSQPGLPLVVEPVHGGRPRPMSEIAWLGDRNSQTVQVTALFQLLNARRRGAQLIIVDGADLLTEDYRLRLYNMMLSGEAPHALLAEAWEPREGVADPLAEAGIGRTYVIHNGIVRSL